MELTKQYGFCRYCGGRFRYNMFNETLLVCTECSSAVAQQVFSRGYKEKQPRRTDWQPIETAPKDGRRLLFFRDGYFIVGFWDETNNSWAIPDYPPEPINPTHWMPLPDPPEEE